MTLLALLQRSEGDTLDFKRDNYRFRRGSDEEKSELLKDILALANAWKATDAYIIIGVEETHGRATDVIGVPPELNDSDIQQFVSSKTNRPVSFSIEHAEHETRHLTIIRVSQKQARPLFLKKDYGRLKKNVVYIRHGSSTEEASPDEIAEMAKQDLPVNLPNVLLRFHVRLKAYCYHSEFPTFQKDKPRDDDGLEIFARNEGSALARHIEGSIELPRGVFLDYLKAVDLKGGNPLTAISESKPLKLTISNHLREPTHSYLAKPNPLEWKPLLPGREMRIFIDRTIPGKHFAKIAKPLKWELAVDNCVPQRGEIRLVS